MTNKRTPSLSILNADPDLCVSTVCACGCGRLLLKKHRRHRYFANSCRYKAREFGAASMMQRRDRFSRWYDKRRPGHQHCPQLARPPIVGEFLPGAAVAMRFDGYSPTLQTSRSVHGLVTGLLGVPHNEMVPTFSCAPYGNGWGIYCPNEGALRKLAGHKVQNALFEVDQTISFGPLMRLRYPVMPNARGWRLLRVDAVTPVVIKSTHTKTGKTRVKQTGTERLLLGAMVSLAKFRLGIDLSDKTLCATVESHVMPESVDVGGKLGVVRGFSGYVVVRTNAVGEWILRVAEQIGLGSRVGFGFGRIKVSPWQQSVDSSSVRTRSINTARASTVTSATRKRSQNSSKNQPAPTTSKTTSAGRNTGEGQGRCD